MTVHNIGKTAFVFSGQGAQAPGMGKALCDKSEAALAVFKMADSIRPGTSEQCFGSTKEELDTTINTQPCLFTVDLAAARAIEALGVKADMAAGFSLGEISALAFSGALSDEDAFRLVCKRAEFMQEAAEKNPGAMGAALGISEERLNAVLSEYEGAQAVNFNCPGQIVAAAKEADIAEIAVKIKANGGKFIKLAVSGAFHSHFMDEASGKMAEYVKEIFPAAPAIPIYANYSAKPYPCESEGIKELITKQINNAVKWEQTVRNMIEDGAAVFIETGEGKVLSGLIKKINKDVRVFHYTDVIAEGGII